MYLVKREFFFMVDKFFVDEILLLCFNGEILWLFDFDLKWMMMLEFGIELLGVLLVMLEVFDFSLFLVFVCYCCKVCFICFDIIVFL